MFLFQDNTIFGNVVKGNRISFKVFAQIDNLMADISAVKVSIFDPDGEETLIQSKNVTVKDYFWYRTDDITYSFDLAGKYTVRFYMKVAGGDDWKLVSEKTITAKSTVIPAAPLLLLSRGAFRLTLRVVPCYDTEEMKHEPK